MVDHTRSTFGATARLSGVPSRRGLFFRVLTGVAVAAAAIFPSLPGAHAAAPARPTAKMTITVGAKGFPENEIVAYMYILLLQHAGIPVNSSLKDNLASQVATPALQHGDIDIFPEYTGTGLEAILQETAPHTSAAYYTAVAAGYRKKFNLIWLQPYPLNDTQGFATTRAIAKQYGLRSITDMVKNASKLRLIVATEYLGRADGLPGLEKVYGMFTPKALVKLQDVGSVRYEALLQGQGDVTEAFTTDPQIASDHLVVLSDPKGYAPPDNLAPVVRADVLRTYPSLKQVLNQIAPKMTNAAITLLSSEVAIQHQDAETVARTFLTQQGFLK
jgi:osmoprotectant transport system substrate-binding protein